MKKIILTFLLGAAVFASGFAQVSEGIADKAFKIMENTEDILAYHGDYSATMSLVIDKPGKPRENLQYKVFQRTDDNLMTLVQLFPEADKGVGYLRDNENIWSYDPISRKFHTLPSKKHWEILM